MIEVMMKIEKKTAKTMSIGRCLRGRFEVGASLTVTTLLCTDALPSQPVRGVRQLNVNDAKTRYCGCGE
ncbi:hypothetical protein GCM10027416_22640 [Okibacterium endophyticum]